MSNSHQRLRDASGPLSAPAPPVMLSTNSATSTRIPRQRDYRANGEILTKLSDDISDGTSQPARHRPPQAQRPIVGLVAAKNPVAALVITVESLFAGGACGVLVVDDGSDDPASLMVFDQVEKLGVKVIHLPENMGKSRALRAGFSSLRHDYKQDFIIVQVDDDTYAGDLAIPAKMITDGKADIVDIRVETFNGTNLISNVQQLQYWLTNAVIKRIQDGLRARLWISGASVMYTSEAAQVLLVPPSFTKTEDTEGRFRAIGAGFKLRYCSSPASQFKTMVPETMSGLRHQWKRWALGNGQVLGIHGFGGGNLRIALVNIMSWVIMLTTPVLQFFVHDWMIVPWAAYVPGGSTFELPYVGTPLSVLMWMVVFGLVVGLAGAIRLRRASLLLFGVFIPLISLWWAFHAVEGLARAVKNPRAKSLTWVPPQRMETKELVDA